MPACYDAAHARPVERAGASHPIGCCGRRTPGVVQWRAQPARACLRGATSAPQRVRSRVDATTAPGSTPPSSASPSSSQRASGSSFYTAMRILPQAQREAMYEIYNFCRCVDDIADSSGPRPQRQAQLNEWRAQVSALFQGKVGPLVTGLAQPVRDFGLAEEDFLAVIDGMEMDTVEDVRAPTLATLDIYCDRVASAVGRLSVR